MYMVTSYCTDQECRCDDRRGVIEGYAETREEAEEIAAASLYPEVEITEG